MNASPAKYPDVTNQLAQYVLATRAEDLPAHGEAVRRRFEK